VSRVYFHSPSGEAELWGGERAWLGCTCTHMARGLLDVQNNHERVHELVPDRPGWEPYPAWPSPDYFARFQQWRQSVEISLSASLGEGRLTWHGKPIDTFSLVLNTAARAGGNALKLAARIHGQCEIHCYAEGADRAWLAGIIDEGLETGVFRRGTGHGREESWEHVAAFLRERDDEPVVLSYSVCDQFPSRWEAGWEPPPGTDLRPSWADPGDWATMGAEEREKYHQAGRDECWGELETGERWRIAMDALRRKGGGLRLDPAGWGDFYFGHGLSVFDILAADFEERLSAALLGKENGDE